MTISYVKVPGTPILTHRGTLRADGGVTTGPGSSGSVPTASPITSPTPRLDDKLAVVLGRGTSAQGADNGSRPDARGSREQGPLQKGHSLPPILQLPFTNKTF